MNIFERRYGDKNSHHNQTAMGNNNLQYQDNRVNVRYGGGTGCVYGGFPSLEKCDGAFGPGCRYQWNCPTYHQYVNNINWD